MTTEDDERMTSRLADLRRDYQLGQGQLQQLGRQEEMLRETLLRISGAIQVLEEFLAPSDADSPATLRVP
ncbi:hypothetical protein JIG36_00325 [Actinoplanes sp. LDG1-06]|uniref:Uncharacterized protein n=1 Tax=Paractinoplanes ovalisporus TaxID=2810368 RepID=A0ABS2A2S5_9ACTN|nr:hypothetical protein [Actinoplanes ovalisporus]MBM2614000.1 hypothetical protein [Actinoplanes ovalisporus]